jgi:large subunit ribosomal protein L18
MKKNLQRKANQNSARRVARVRSRVKGAAERPRLAVARTLKHIYAQIIDDASGKTLAAASDRDVKAKDLKPVEVAMEVGKVLAERASAKKIAQVVFDRRDKRYHGRVKAVAEGARAGGLKF